MYRMFVIGSFALCALAGPVQARPADGRRWLAGDHHVHSIYSAQYRADPAHPHAPPAPIIGGDSSHTIVENARMARRFGLSWMVSTDHGGPRHSVLNHDRAWPDGCPSGHGCAAASLSDAAD